MDCLPDITLSWDIYSSPRTPDEYDSTLPDPALQVEFQEASVSDFLATYEPAGTHSLYKHYGPDSQDYFFFPIQTYAPDSSQLQDVNYYVQSNLKRKFDHSESDVYLNYQPHQPTPFLPDDTNDYICVGSSSDYSASSSNDYTASSSHSYAASSSNDYAASSSNDYAASSSNDYAASSSNDYAASTSNGYTAAMSNAYTTGTSNDYTASSSNDYTAGTAGTAATSYDYRAGTSNDYTAGSSKDHRAGTSNDYTTGTSNDYTTGVTTDYTAGVTTDYTAAMTNEYTTGVTTDCIVGTTSDYIAGTTKDYTAGASSSHVAATTKDYSVATTNDYTNAATNDYTNAATNDYTTAINAIDTNDYTVAANTIDTNDYTTTASNAVDTGLDISATDTVIDANAINTAINTIISTNIISNGIVDTNMIDTTIGSNIDTNVIDTNVIDTNVIDTNVIDTNVINTAIATNVSDINAIDTTVDTNVIDTIIDTNVIDTIIDTNVIDTVIDTNIVDTTVDTNIIDTVIDTGIIDNTVDNTIDNTVIAANLKPLSNRVCITDLDHFPYDHLSDESHPAFEALCSYVTDVDFGFLAAADFRPLTCEHEHWPLRLEPVETDTEPSSRDEMLKDSTSVSSPGGESSLDLLDEDFYIRVGEKTIKVSHEELELIRAMMRLEFPDNDPQYQRPKEKGPEPYHVPETLQQTSQSIAKVFEYGIPFKSLQSREESIILPPKETYIVDGVSYLGAEPTDTLYDPVFIRRLPSDFDNCGWCEICGKWLQLRNHTYAHHFKSIHGVSQRTKSVVRLPRVIRGEAGDAEKMQGFCELCQTWIDLHHRRDGKRWQTWYIHQFQAHHKEDQRLDALRPVGKLDEKLEKFFDGYLDSP